MYKAICKVFAFHILLYNKNAYACFKHRLTRYGGKCGVWDAGYGVRDTGYGVRGQWKMRGRWKMRGQWKMRGVENAGSVETAGSVENAGCGKCGVSGKCVHGSLYKQGACLLVCSLLKRVFSLQPTSGFCS